MVPFKKGTVYGVTEGQLSGCLTGYWIVLSEGRIAGN